MTTNPSYTPEQLGVRIVQKNPHTFHVEFYVDHEEKDMQIAQSEYYLEQIKIILANHPEEKVNFINDTRAISNLSKLANQARANYAQAYAMPGVGKVAMVGMGKWLKSMITIFTTFANRASQTAFFDTPEEALRWMEEA